MSTRRKRRTAGTPRRCIDLEPRRYTRRSTCCTRCCRTPCKCPLLRQVARAGVARAAVKLRRLFLPRPKDYCNIGMRTHSSCTRSRRRRRSKMAVLRCCMCTYPNILSASRHHRHWALRNCPRFQTFRAGSSRLQSKCAPQSLPPQANGRTPRTSVASRRHGPSHGVDSRAPPWKQRRGSLESGSRLSRRSALVTGACSCTAERRGRPTTGRRRSCRRAFACQPQRGSSPWARCRC